MSLPLINIRADWRAESACDQLSYRESYAEDQPPSNTFSIVTQVSHYILKKQRNSAHLNDRQYVSAAAEE